MKTLLCMAASAALLASAAPAQERDFLNTSESAQIREAQEPNDRITLYLQFAKKRIELVKSLLSKERTGRPILIHDALDDYARIIDAIDQVTDDALKRKRDVTHGLDVQGSSERDMLSMLERIRDSHPKDSDHYEFVLKMAIETTADSIDMARTDAGERAQDVEARAAREKKALDANRAVTESEAKKDAADAAANPKPAEAPQRKPPTLLKPGEKPSTLSGPPGGGRGGN